MISLYKDLQKKAALWLSLVIAHSMSRHKLATSSENVVASTQFLVALVTSESQLRALDVQLNLLFHSRDILFHL